MSPAPARITTAQELRHAWTEFFAERGHTSVPSGSLIPTHPSAPMFTNSGMMPFVPYFLGEEPVPFVPPRAVSVQKCVRVGGKHNDLDAIGRSPRHLSFFEMLGNFAFGDYFKAEAIPWAWEFVTETLGIDGDRLWITCHVSDDEAEEIWADSVGVPRDRIQRLDKDNFWEMGETGPCGPSSEIFFDYGPELGPDGGPANELAENRFVEIWNLVFNQYFRGQNGELTDLPTKNIDTGAGMERILAVLAGSPSLYAADVLSLLVDEAQSVTGQRIGDDPLSDIALRLLADHTRTASFLVADGVVPSNEDRGYVLRRIIRRAGPLRLHAGRRAPDHAVDGRTQHRDHGRCVPGARRPAHAARRHDRSRRGAVPSHARPGVGAARHGARLRRRRCLTRRRCRLRAARHLRVPARGHPGDGRPPWRPGRPGRLRACHERTARTVASRGQAHRSRDRR